jgi:hypothetical protein
MSKKGTHISFSLKTSRQTNLLQVPQRGRYGERCPLTGHFYMSFNISLYLKGPKTKASLHVPQKRGPNGKRLRGPETFLPISQGPQQGRPLSRFPSHSSHRERERERETAHFQSPFQRSLKVPSMSYHLTAKCSCIKTLNVVPFFTQLFSCFIRCN